MKKHEKANISMIFEIAFMTFITWKERKSEKKENVIGWIAGDRRYTAFLFGNSTKWFWAGLIWSSLSGAAAGGGYRRTYDHPYSWFISRFHWARLPSWALSTTSWNPKASAPSPQSAWWSTVCICPWWRRSDRGWHATSRTTLSL